MIRTLAAALVTTTCLMAIATPVAAQTGEFNIPAGSLRAALDAFARQSGRQVIYQTDVRSARSSGVRGAHTAEEALDAILAGTGFTARKDTSGAFAIVKMGNAGAHDAVAASGDQEAPAHAAHPNEIVVTGSYIRGTPTVGSSLITIDRREIDRAGFATARDIVRSLPQNSRGGVNENTIIGQGSSNFSSASAANLRGLGTDSTLVLINGRRIPVAGRDGNFADISTIPAGAIDKVEVLPDGASAIYGADAVAGVINFVLRKDFKGAETRVRYGGVTSGGLREFTVDQTFGTAWSTGSALISYEHYEQTPLSYSDRSFTRSADLRSMGGSDFRNIYGNPGNILDNALNPAYAIPHGQNGTALRVSDLLAGQVNRQDDNWALDTFAKQNRESVYGRVEQKIGSSVTVFAEGQYSDRRFASRTGTLFTVLAVPQSNPFFVDPFNRGFTYLGYDFGRDFGPAYNRGAVKASSGVGGVDVDLFGDWQLRSYFARSEESTDGATSSVNMIALSAALADPNPATAFNPFGDGSFTNPQTIAALRTDITSSTNSLVWNGNVMMDGTLVRLPGGAVKLAIGGDYRRERYHYILNSPGFGYASDSLMRRSVKAAFAELVVPAVGRDNPLPGVERLTLSAAIRHESYADRLLGASPLSRNPGSTTNPKFGLDWVPVSGLTLRASYGTSFRAPNLPTLAVVNTSAILQEADPRSPSGFSSTIYRDGVSDRLGDEKSKNWRLGATIAPPSIPGLQLDIGYFGIRFKDRIATPAAPGSILSQEDRYSSIVIRNPTQAQIDAACGTGFQGDRSICVQGAIAAIIDGRLLNIATSNVDGIDFSARYSLATRHYGHFDFGLNGTYMLDFKEAYGAGTTVFDEVNTVNHPISLTLRGSAAWISAHGFSVTGYLNYQGSYRDNVSTPSRPIGSFTTVDLNLMYETGSRPAIAGLRNLSIGLNVQNLFNTSPPFVNNPLGIGYDPENADPRGRFISMSLSKRW